MRYLLHRCSCQKGLQVYRKLIHPLQVILLQMIYIIHLIQAREKGEVVNDTSSAGTKEGKGGK